MKIITLVSALVALFAVSCSSGIHKYASTSRPPSFPLAVRTPYNSIWLNSNMLPGTWPTFWTGAVKGWTGMIRVDGQSYVYMGNPGGLEGLSQVAVQKASYITPTQTMFVIGAGPVELTVKFLSPVEYKDVKRQSIPLSYVFLSVKSAYGAKHQVEVYMDIPGEFVSSNTSQMFKWSLDNHNNLKTWAMELMNQHKFAEWADYPHWGQAVLTTTDGATHTCGPHVDVRKTFAKTGTLDNTTDPNFRCIKCNWPIVAFAHDLGKVGRKGKSVQFTIGHIREENINLRGVPQKALWTYYFESVNQMIEFFFKDAQLTMEMSDKLDNKLLNDAFAAGGQDYADIISLSLRQAFAGTEFSGNITHPMLYQKEISSNGNMQTVDVIYPASPMWYYLNPKYLAYLLEPLFHQMEGGYWPKKFAMHDIGLHYPNATGHDNGEGEDMPIEESANMILMVANIALHPKADVNEWREYVRGHFPILNQWADYLFHNSLRPANQLTTDDFIGRTQLNSGLALKGFLAMKAFARLASLIGDENVTSFYDVAVGTFVPIWYKESIHHSGGHLKMEYNVTEGYQLKYNAFQDKLLNLRVLAEEVYLKEAAFYLTKEEAYGIPLVSTQDYTKSDWEMWTAAAFGDESPLLRTHIIKNMARYLRDTPNRIPFSDWYVTATGKSKGFKARPVVGGHFAILARNIGSSAGGKSNGGVTGGGGSGWWLWGILIVHHFSLYHYYPAL